jgi:hypothetical protein
MESVEACQHYIETFYISATLKQLEKDLARSEAQHGDCFATVSVERVFRQLQIDFHCVSMRHVDGGSPIQPILDRRQRRALSNARSPRVGGHKSFDDEDELEMCDLII